MLKRVITGAVLVVILVPALLFYDTPATPLLWAVIAAVSVYETAKCVGIKGRVLTASMCALAAVLPIVQYVIGWGSEVGVRYAPILLTSAFVAVYLLYAAGVFGFMKPKLSPTVELFMMLVYVSAASVSAVAISQSAHGGFILPIIFLGSWITDSFAYFCGSFFGKHKLIPKISPKKTVEGSVGGVIFCGIFCAVYGLAVASVTGLTVCYAALLGTGLLLSVVSQIGDLNASYIKRTHGIKDFGKIFPGHGGMLDRFDSVIATVPFLYILSRFFTYFA